MLGVAHPGSAWRHEMLRRAAHAGAYLLVMVSRGLALVGFFIGSLLYRSFRAGEVTWGIALDAAAVALITTALLYAYAQLAGRKRT